MSSLTSGGGGSGRNGFSCSTIVSLDKSSTWSGSVPCSSVMMSRAVSAAASLPSGVKASFISSIAPASPSFASGGASGIVPSTSPEVRGETGGCGRDGGAVS